MTHSSLLNLIRFSLMISMMLIVSLSLMAPTALAQITNPAVGADLGGNAPEAQAGATFARYFVTLWRGVITVGAIILLIYFLWGAIEWITAGGDSGKIQKARDRLTQSVVGFIILVSAAVIIAFIGRVFFGNTLDLFRLEIPNASTINEGNTGRSFTINTPGGNTRVTAPDPF